MTSARRLILILTVVFATRCDRRDEAFRWPTVDPQVAALARTTGPAVTQTWPKRPPPRAPSASATAPAHTLGRAEALDLIERVAAARSPHAATAAWQAIDEASAALVDPLIDVIADPATRSVVIESVLPELIRLGTTQDLASSAEIPCPIELRPLTPDAGRIVDAIATCLETRPLVRFGAAYLAEIVPLDRLPRLVQLIRSSSDERQATWIGVFDTLTHSRHAVLALGGCGTTTADEHAKQQRDMLAAQRQSAADIAEWWRRNRDRPYPEWAVAAAREFVQREARQIEASLAQDRDVWQRAWTIRESAPLGSMRFGPSVFDALVGEFNAARPFARPFILGMIARTRHPGAAEFVAPHLSSPDADLQFAAVSSLRATNDTVHMEALRRLLPALRDSRTALEAIAALAAHDAEQSLTAFARRITDPDDLVRNAARDALRPFLVDRAAELTQLADHSLDPVGAVALRTLLSEAAARARLRDPHDTAPDIISRLLSSDSPDDQTRGIALVSQFRLAPRIPDIIRLLHVDDPAVEAAAANALVSLGIPGLSPANAASLLGHSLKLDRHIAAYCYARYGREALPLLRKVAFRWEDVDQYGRPRTASPAVGLIQALVREHDPWVTQDVVRLVHTAPRREYMALLELLDDPDSAALIRRLLTDLDSATRLRAVQVARARKLTGIADTLARLAAEVPDEPWRIAQVHYHAGKLTYEEFTRIGRQWSSQPAVAFEAMQTLVVRGDDRAWALARDYLATDALDWRKGPAFRGVADVTEFGSQLAGLKERRRSEFHDLLRAELTSSARPWVVIALTTALAGDPVVADADILRAVASTPHADRRARTLAAVALARLGDRRVIPLLRAQVREALRVSVQEGYLDGDDLESSLSWRPAWPAKLLLLRRALLSEHTFTPPFTVTLTRDHLDVAAALRQFGDTALEDEARSALITARGSLNPRAFKILVGLGGGDAFRSAQQWIAEHNPDLAPALAMAAVTEAADVLPRDELVGVIRRHATDDGLVFAALPAITRRGLVECADAVAASYHDADEPSWHAANVCIADALCRLGDLRGLDLALRGPLILHEIACYLPEAPFVLFPEQAFIVNQIDDGLRVQAWYREHRPRLKWDPNAQQFRCTPGAPSASHASSRPMT